jgi:hypothetical protein
MLRLEGNGFVAIVSPGERIVVWGERGSERRFGFKICTSVMGYPGAWVTNELIDSA